MIPKMPDEFKGKVSVVHYDEYDKKIRKWTKEEEDWVYDMVKEGYKVREIAESIDRELTCTSIKVKRLKKKYNEYNEKHLDDKYSKNLEYLKLFDNNISILDVFCGVNKFYNSHGYTNVLTNDKNKSINADYNMDADKFLKMIVKEGRTFDLVDLDPFGASISYLENALKITKKGLIMTLGELGHKRWKRLDFVGKYYSNINTIEDITIENMIDEIIRIADDNGVKLEVCIYKDWGNIGRVWFLIK